MHDALEALLLCYLPSLEHINAEYAYPGQHMRRVLRSAKQRHLLQKCTSVSAASGSSGDGYRALNKCDAYFSLPSVCQPRLDSYHEFIRTSV